TRLRRSLTHLPVSSAHTPRLGIVCRPPTQVVTKPVITAAVGGQDHSGDDGCDHDGGHHSHDQHLVAHDLQPECVCDIVRRSAAASRPRDEQGGACQQHENTDRNADCCLLPMGHIHRHQRRVHPHKHHHIDGHHSHFHDHHQDRDHTQITLF